MNDSGDRDAVWPVFAADEIEAVAAVLRSGRVNQWTGDTVARFEAAFAAWIARRHGVALANGTVALELALHALGVGTGDEVIVPSRTFIATASAAVMRGAAPVVADVDRDSQNLTAASVEPLLGPRTRAIVAVHLGGWPCEMTPLRELCARAGVALVEDCAQAPGARYRDRPVGSFGEMSAFSFCQDKIITTGGEGGLLACDDDALAERAWSFKDHGKSPDSRKPQPGAVFRWVHDGFGTNWRMTAMQAAIGLVQLAKAPGWVARRRHNAYRLAGVLAALPALRVPLPPAHIAAAFYRLYAFVRPARLAPGWSRDRIIAEVRARGGACQYGVCAEIYRERAFTDRGLGPPARLPVARELDATSLAFPVDPTYDDDRIDRLGAIVGDVVGAATC